MRIGLIGLALVFGCSDGGDDGDDGTVNPNRDGGVGNVDRDGGTGGNDRDGGIVETQCNPDFGMAQACGGDLTGTWSYRAACATSPVADAITQFCGNATIQADRFEGGTGNITIAGTAFSQMITVNVHVEATVPIACTQGFGCAGAQTALGTALPGSTATCTMAGADCSCTVDGPVTTTSQGTVTTSGGVATVDGTDTYYYCVTGDQLEYRRFDNGDNPVFVLSK